MKKLYKFSCEKCGSNQLAYRKWVECTEMITQENGHIEYCRGQVDQSKELGAESCYICGNCGTQISLRGFRVETEKELISYLSMTNEQRKEEEQAELKSFLLEINNSAIFNDPEEDVIDDDHRQD